MNINYLFLLFSVMISFVAHAAPQLVYVPLDKPCRIVDTRGFASPFSASKETQSFRAWGSLTELNAQRDEDGSDQFTDCQSSLDTIPTALVANVTAAAKRYKAKGNLVAYPTGSTTPDSSLINFQRNNIANSSIISLNAEGNFDVKAQLFGNEIDNQHKTDVIVDAMGYFYPKSAFNETTAPSGLTYVPLPVPCRIIDTRGANLTYESSGSVTNMSSRHSFLAWGSQTELDAQRDIDGSKKLPACQPQAGAIPSAAVANVTAVAKAHGSRGNLIVFPAASDTPNSSLVNFRANNIANSSILTLNSEGSKHLDIQVNLFSSGLPESLKADVVVDIMGYFYPQTSFDDQAERPDMTYVPLPNPCRIVDTRGFDSPFEQTSRTTHSVRAWGTKAELNLQRDLDDDKNGAACLPESGLIPAVLVGNVTVAAKRFNARGNIVTHAQGTPPPDSSLINFNGNNIANASILSLSPDNEHRFDIEARLFGSEAGNQRKADVIVDVMGYFYPGGWASGPGTTTRVSTIRHGGGGDAPSHHPSISADGRFIAFESTAKNLVNNQSNIPSYELQRNIFVRDRQTDIIQQVSVASDGTTANRYSQTPSISADGRFIAFASRATNLTEVDNNSIRSNIFVHNRQTGITQLVSVASDGSQANDDSSDPSISADGRFITFASKATNLVVETGSDYQDIFVHDRQTGITQMISAVLWNNVVRWGGSNPSISANGRFIAFIYISNIVVHDRQTGITQIVSVPVDGKSMLVGHKASSPNISSNGRFIAFQSLSDQLVAGDSNKKTDIFVHDRQTGITQRVSRGIKGREANGDSSGPSISADGQFIAFSSRATNLITRDFNGSSSDVYVYNRQTDITQRVSVTNDSYYQQSFGASSTSNISANGLFIAFVSTQRNLGAGSNNIDVYVHDRQTSIIQRVSVANGETQSNRDSYTPSISADGRFIVFLSSADNLGSPPSTGKPYVFVHDRLTGLNQKLLIDGLLYPPGISGNGRFIVFASRHPTLVVGDSNLSNDIFVYDRQTSITQRVSITSNGVQGNHDSFDPSISADGRFITFMSYATNLVEGDTNNSIDIFMHDRQAGITKRISVSSDGMQADLLSYTSRISSDGRFIGFLSKATNLDGEGYSNLKLFVHEHQTGITQHILLPELYFRSGAEYPGNVLNISANGRFIAIIAVRGFLIHDRQTGITQHISESYDGTEGVGFLHSLDLSADGRFVAFSTNQSGWVEGDDLGGSRDIYVYDRQTDITQWISVASDGTKSNDHSYAPSISADGRFITFDSLATTLVEGDSNRRRDIFVHELAP